MYQTIGYIIKGLECCSNKYKDRNCDNCPYINIDDEHCVEELASDALRFMKVRTPAKTIQVADSMHHCPGCRTVVMFEQKFCHECGHPLYWEKEEEQNG